MEITADRIPENAHEPLRIAVAEDGVWPMERAALRGMIRAGLSDRQIGSYCGVGPDDVCRLRDRYGIDGEGADHDDEATVGSNGPTPALLRQIAETIDITSLLLEAALPRPAPQVDEPMPDASLEDIAALLDRAVEAYAQLNAEIAAPDSAPLQAGTALPPR